MGCEKIKLESLDELIMMIYDYNKIISMCDKIIQDKQIGNKCVNKTFYCDNEFEISFEYDKYNKTINIYALNDQYVDILLLYYETHKTLHYDISDDIEEYHWTRVKNEEDYLTYVRYRINAGINEVETYLSNLSKFIQQPKRVN